MAQMMWNARLDRLALYLMEDLPFRGETLHTAEEAAGAALDELQAAVKEIDPAQKNEILDAAIDYSATVERIAFAYGMRTGAQLLKNLFSETELLF